MLGGWVPNNDDNTSSLMLLRYMHLDSNNLGGPLPMLVLPELKRLNLHDNAFTSMPERFFADMRQLEKVYIGNNTLLEEWSLPTDLRVLARLETFEASHGCINKTLTGFLDNTMTASLCNIPLADIQLVDPVPETIAN
jgi:Leucine-rich repeat (LRR) protein